MRAPGLCLLLALPVAAGCGRLAPVDADSGRVDSGGVDASGVDAGDVDAGGLDAGRLDAARLDAGRPDSGGPDAFALDGGTDGCASSPDGDTLRPPRSVFPSWPLPGTPGHPHDYDVRPLTVVDRVTGLEWERNVPGPPPGYAQPDALAYCSALCLDGKTDWRLPTRIELLSIVDEASYNPAIDPVAFPSTPPGRFWTSSPLAGPVPGSGWYVDFGGGVAAYGGGVSSADRVRCVR